MSVSIFIIIHIQADFDVVPKFVLKTDTMIKGIKIAKYIK